LVDTQLGARQIIFAPQQLHRLLTQVAERTAPTSVATLERKHQEESAVMNRVRTAVTAAAIAGSMLIGGVVGATLYGVSALSAAAATNAASPTPAAGAPSGTFVPNETAAHEATESAAREAQENAGQVPTVP